MHTITLGTPVAITGTPYTGRVVAEIKGTFVVEIDGQQDGPPTSLCWRSEDGTVLWPCQANELDVLPAS
jgi:hypothetical protein